MTDERRNKLEDLGFEWDAPEEIKQAKRLEKQKHKEGKEKERAEKRGESVNYV